MSEQGGFQISIFLHLVRALFPRWNFFDQVGESVHLEYQTEETSTWNPVSFVVQRPKLGFLLNPATHFALAERCIVEEFSEEVTNPQVQNLVLFQLVQNIVESRMKAKGWCGPYQFRLLLLSELGSDEIYCSPKMPWGMTPEGT